MSWRHRFWHCLPCNATVCAHWPQEPGSPPCLFAAITDSSESGHVPAPRELYPAGAAWEDDMPFESHMWHLGQLKAEAMWMGKNGMVR